MADDKRPTECSNIYQFTVPDLLHNTPVNFCQAYHGKVLLIVNTASKCAFTGQYEGLEKLYSEYKDRGLVVLGFPSNQFAGQEPGTPTEIQNFCRLTYGVEFPMFAKSQVKKKGADPIWQYLGETSGTYPKWNFYKYLIDRQGKVVDVYSSISSPDTRKFRNAIEALL
ncbi:glutathione peroxidase [Pontibacter sp. JAM-7]|uniref:glutathione peroxidase n=1 Tax=Pontibacter sp. JAM-7 TaxID=3366581 RepID=UPI003AF6055D